MALLGTLAFASYLGNQCLEGEISNTCCTLMPYLFTKSWAVLHDSAIIDGKITKNRFNFTNKITLIFYDCPLVIIVVAGTKAVA